jgi:porin
MNCCGLQAIKRRMKETGGVGRQRYVFAVAALFLETAAGAARAEAAGTADVTVSLRETADAWRNLDGGVQTGWTALNKLQIGATWTARALGDPGLKLHLQVFRTNGERLTSRLGDVETASNIEALSATRLMEAWADQGFGREGHGGLAVRVGLIDLNSDFDSIDPAGLFINSSHGIAPDLSKSGLNGPSIFPVGGAAVRLTWTPTPDWTLRGGLFDGVPGDPARPKAFAAVRLGGGYGTLAIAQIDRKLSRDVQLSLGAWRYSAQVPAVDGRGMRTDAGVYGFIEGPLPGAQAWKGWVRVGHAAPGAQLVSGYLGAGMTRASPIRGRADDQLGFAVSHAVISPAARRLQGLPAAETTFEATYQCPLTPWMAVQPDVQYVVHPASAPGLPNALAVGLRVVFTADYSRGAPAAGR